MQPLTSYCRIAKIRTYCFPLIETASVEENDKACLQPYSFYHIIQVFRCTYRDLLYLPLLSLGNFRGPSRQDSSDLSLVFSNVSHNKLHADKKVDEGGETLK